MQNKLQELLSQAKTEDDFLNEINQSSYGGNLAEQSQYVEDDPDKLKTLNDGKHILQNVLDPSIDPSQLRSQADNPLFVAPEEFATTELSDVNTVDQQARQKEAERIAQIPKPPTNEMAQQEIDDMNELTPMAGTNENEALLPPSGNVLDKMEPTKPPTPPTEYEKLQAQLQELRDLEAAQNSTAAKYNFGSKAAAIIGDTLSRYNTGGIQKNAKANIQYTGPKLQELMSIIGEVKAPGTKDQREQLLNQYKQMQIAQMSKAKTDALATEGDLNRKGRLEVANIAAKAKNGDKNSEGLTPYQAKSISMAENNQLNKNVTDLKNRYQKEGIPAQVTNMIEISKFLKDNQDIDLNDPDFIKNIKTKKINIEGQGILGKHNLDFNLSPSALRFRQNVQGLANQLLKARSGAAVTDQEYQRFLGEVSKGSFSSERDLVIGLQKMKNDLNSIIKNEEAIDEVTASEYERRTGNPLFSKVLNSSTATTFPMTLHNKNGDKATVSNETELKEAKSEGFN